MERPDWDQTWLDVAKVMARRSLCVRSAVGSVIVGPDQKIVGTGYNGPPAGMRFKTSCDGWCPRAMNPSWTATHDDCVSSHAEMNALMYTDRIAREGGTLYTTRAPCFSCAKAVANSGLKRVVFILNREMDAHLEPERSIHILSDSGLKVDIREL